MSEWTALRSRVLREPLGLRYTEADFEEERDDRHLVGVIDGRVVGGLLVRTAGQPVGVWKLRQFAVDTPCQRCGIGRRLLETAEFAAHGEGVREMVLHSRVVVTGFYTKLGFHAEGESFEEIGIPHRRMRKRL